MLNNLRIRLARALVGNARLPMPVKTVYTNNYTPEVIYSYLSRVPDLRPTDQGLAMAAEASVWAYRCIQARARAVSRVKWRVVDRSGNEDKAHPFYNTVRYSQHVLRQDLFFRWEHSLSVFGEAYFEKLTRPGGNIPGGLSWVNPLAIEPEISRGRLYRFVASGDDGTHYFMPDQIVYQFYPNTLDDFRGSSPLGKALDGVNIKRNIQRYVRAFFENDATPGGIISSKDNAPIPEPEAERIQKEWGAQNKGVHNSFRWKLLTAGLEVKQFDQPDLDTFEGLSEEQRTEICVALNVPKAMVDAGDVKDPLSAVGTMDSQQAGFIENWLIPEYDDIAAVLNADVLPWLTPGGGYRFEPDYTELLTTIKRTKDRSEKIRGEYKDGIISLNEARDDLGYEAIPGGDMFVVANGAIMLPANRLSEAPELTRPPAQQFSFDMSQPAPATQAIDSAPVIEAPPPPALPAGGKSFCVMLSLANNTDLIALQQKVASHYADIPIEWSDPADFHITLGYAPAVSDLQAKLLSRALDMLDLPDLALRVGSLKAFDNVGSYALHFRVRRNVDLLELQEAVYDLCDDLGIQLSGHHQPAAFIPHITLGYATQKPRGVTFTGKVLVVPDSLYATHGDERSEVYRRALDEKAAAEEDPPEDDKAAKAYAQDDAQAELEAWRKVAFKKHTRTFEAYHLAGDLGDWLAQEVAASEGDKARLKAVFEDAASKLAYKAIQATRLDFENAFDDLLAAGRDKDMTRRKWAANLRAMLRTYGTRAYLDGLEDGGVDRESFSDDDTAEINRLLADQSSYVTQLGGAVFGDNVSDPMADQKAAMWWNKSIQPLYAAGLLSADANSMYEWVYGRTEEHCSDCQALNGQRHRLKQWHKSGWLPQSDRLECNGFNCDCKLKRVKGRARGTLKAYEAHEHSDLVESEASD